MRGKLLIDKQIQEVRLCLSESEELSQRPDGTVCIIHLNQGTAENLHGIFCHVKRKCELKSKCE